MKQAWQPVASVAMSTIPPRTRSSASEDDTVLMTAYSVSFSRLTLARASPPSETCETVTQALLSGGDRNRDLHSPVCGHSTPNSVDACTKPHCGIPHRPDSVAPVFEPGRGA